MEIAYFIIEGDKVAYASPGLNAQAMFKALSVLPIQRTSELETGLFVQPYKIGNSLPDFLIGFTMGNVSMVGVIPWNVAKGRSLRWVARHFWDSNDMNHIVQSRPEFLKLDNEAQPKDGGKYPFITLSMTWPLSLTRYEYAQSKVRHLTLPAVRRMSGASGKKWLAAAVAATAVIAGTYYFYSRNSRIQSVDVSEVNGQTREGVVSSDE